ncbi:MAG: sporulation protein YunB [Clostridia bacterium]|nr:sporulation protein YunB [Clostridia bacterium]MDD4146488.1 sporulation protein YunB [Clostridia bacterium]MDD4666135.1 sporulation protein YunB [Clostridia bacterium]
MYKLSACLKNREGIVKIYEEDGVKKMPHWYKSRRGLKRGMIKIPRILIILIILGLCGVYLFQVIDRNLKPTIIQIAESRAHILATETMNNALYEKILTNTEYEDLMTIHKDSQQRVTLMQANTLKISRILSEANLAIKEALKNLQEETFKIPLGQALNSPLLAHCGPNIKVRLIPVGTVNVRFVDSFQEAGINQTRHILYLNINTTVKIVVPLVTENVVVNNQVPIAETIIIGEVPNAYLGLGSSLSMKDLDIEKFKEEKYSPEK